MISTSWKHWCLSGCIYGKLFDQLMSGSVSSSGCKWFFCSSNSHTATLSNWTSRHIEEDCVLARTMILINHNLWPVFTLFSAHPIALVMRVTPLLNALIIHHTIAIIHHAINLFINWQTLKSHCSKMSSGQCCHYRCHWRCECCMVNWL